MALFDIAGGHELAGKQSVEQPDQVDAQIILNELRIEFRVMRDLDWPWRGKKLPQRRQRLALLHVTIREAIKIDEIHTCGGCKLN